MGFSVRFVLGALLQYLDTALARAVPVIEDPCRACELTASLLLSSLVHCSFRCMQCG